MVELVEVIAKALVDDKDAVEVSSHEEKHATVVQLKVACREIGRASCRERV